MKVEVAVPGSPSLISLRFLCNTQPKEKGLVRAQELCESRGGRPGLPVPNKPTVSVQHSTKGERARQSSGAV